MGFLIDAVAHRVIQTLGDTTMRYYRCCNLAEIIVRTYMLHQLIELRLCLRSVDARKQHRHYAGLLLMVWILKREVRAFGGCLGMYRR